MKRRDLIRHLLQHGCRFVREGSNHSIYADDRLRKSTAVPRRAEINKNIAKKICRDLQIPPP